MKNQNPQSERGLLKITIKLHMLYLPIMHLHGINIGWKANNKLGPLVCKCLMWCYRKTWLYQCKQAIKRIKQAANNQGIQVPQVFTQTDVVFTTGWCSNASRFITRPWSPLASTVSGLFNMIALKHPPAPCKIPGIISSNTIYPSHQPHYKGEPVDAASC